MAENGWSKQQRTGTAVLGLPKLFTGFTVPKAVSDNEAVISPKSILRNSFWSDPNNNSPRTPESKRVVVALGCCATAGLGIANILQDEESAEALAKTEPRPALFGSKLKIQISPRPALSLINTTLETPSSRSSSDFGIMTKNSIPPGNIPAIPLSVPKGASPGTAFNGCLSSMEMEMSEDYTCVISHGPNPKTTHIYCDCILENSCDSVVELSASSTLPETRSLHPNGHQTQKFLSFCDGCNKSLKENDIYMYRGEKAFCSCECRLQEILAEET